MLYDPKWEKQAETKADPLSITSLVAWLELQTPEQTYCYTNSGACLLHQYFAAMGLPIYSVGPGYYRMDPDPMLSISLPSSFETISVGDGDQPSWTFGAALERARAAR